MLSKAQGSEHSAQGKNSLTLEYDARLTTQGKAGGRLKADGGRKKQWMRRMEKQGQANFR
jgi:hypothetical protein